MREILLTKGYKSLIDDEDFEKVSCFKWQVKECCERSNTNYATRGIYLGRVNGKLKRVTEGLENFILGTAAQIDHIDGNGLNNQKGNLRIATTAQNGANKGKLNDLLGIPFTSKYKGVNKRSNGTYRTTIKKDNQGYHIGTFKTEKEAARAYDSEAIKLFGEFAKTNYQLYGDV